MNVARSSCNGCSRPTAAITRLCARPSSATGPRAHSATSARRSGSPKTSSGCCPQVWGWSEEGVEPKHAEELNLNSEDRRLKLTIDIARELIGTPRHLSQHPGGFVLTHDRLDELVPIEPAAMHDRQVIEWDKDDIDALKFMKVDCLALGMLTCMQRAFDLLAEHKGIDLDLATIPRKIRAPTP